MISYTLQYDIILDTGQHEIKCEIKLIPTVSYPTELRNDSPRTLRPCWAVISDCRLPSDREWIDSLMSALAVYHPRNQHHRPK